MKKIVIIFSLLLCQSATAIAETEYEGGLREYFLTANEYNFSSDHVAQIKREIVEAGFQSVTLHLRMAVKSKHDSIVYHPSFKTSRVNLEIMIESCLLLTAIRRWSVTD